MDELSKIPTLSAWQKPCQKLIEVRHVECLRFENEPSRFHLSLDSTPLLRKAESEKKARGAARFKTMNQWSTHARIKAKSVRILYCRILSKFQHWNIFASISLICFFVCITHDPVQMQYFHIFYRKQHMLQQYWRTKEVQSISWGY